MLVGGECPRLLEDGWAAVKEIMIRPVAIGDFTIYRIGAGRSLPGEIVNELGKVAPSAAPILDLRHRSEIPQEIPRAQAEYDAKQYSRIVLHDVGFAATAKDHRNLSVFARHYHALQRDSVAHVALAIHRLEEFGAVAVACQLGRDRTGIVVAQVLARLGEGRDAIRADAELTYSALGKRAGDVYGQSQIGSEFAARNHAARDAFALVYRS